MTKTIRQKTTSKQDELGYIVSIFPLFFIFGRITTKIVSISPLQIEIVSIFPLFSNLKKSKKIID